MKGLGLDLRPGLTPTKQHGCETEDGPAKHAERLRFDSFVIRVLFGAVNSKRRGRRARARWSAEEPIGELGGGTLDEMLESSGPDEQHRGC